MRSLKRKTRANIDPAPSIISYRLMRLMLIPRLRLILTLGIPSLVIFFGALVLFLNVNFNENIDLVSQKIRISQKIENLNIQINALNNKLKNKAYVKNAPKEIVQNDKKLLKELTIEDGKLRSIVSSIN